MLWFNDLQDCDIWLVIFPSALLKQKVLLLGPCIFRHVHHALPGSEYRRVWPYFPHAHSNTQTQTHVRVAANPCACCEMPARSFTVVSFHFPSLPCGKNAQKFLLTRNSLKTSTHTNTLVLKEEGFENAKKTPKRHFASSGKERLEWKGECSPEAWWIDEWREGERVKASRRQRRPCLVVGWVREGGSFGLLRDRQASFS